MKTQKKADFTGMGRVQTPTRCGSPGKSLQGTRLLPEATVFERISSEHCPGICVGDRLV